MKYDGLQAGRALALLVLALAAGACSTADDRAVTDPSAPLAGETPPSGLAPMDWAPSRSLTTGIPFGPFAVWRTNNTLIWGPGPFTGSAAYAEPSLILGLISAARSKEMRLVLSMTGGSHERYKTDGKFDLAKWKAVMSAYDKEPIKQAVAAAVADGVIIMNSVMDEPQITDWGRRHDQAEARRDGRLRQEHLPNPAGRRGRALGLASRRTLPGD